MDLCEVDDDDGDLSKHWRDRLARDLRLPGFVEGLEMVAKDRRGLDGKLMTARQNLQRALMRVLATPTPEGGCDGGCNGGEWGQVKISGECTVVVEILVTSVWDEGAGVAVEFGGKEKEEQ